MAVLKSTLADLDNLPEHLDTCDQNANGALSHSDVGSHTCLPSLHMHIRMKDDS